MTESISLVSPVGKNRDFEYANSEGHTIFLENDSVTCIYEITSKILKKEKIIECTLLRPL